MDTKEKPNKEIYKLWHDDHANWRLGILYYNKKDKRLFPPKRLRGFGWTVNLANPYSYLTLLGIILLILAIGMLYAK
jgi:uncharacterized membrane protein